MGSSSDLQPFAVDIHDFGHSGEGVGRYEGLAVFVPGAVPGDTVLVEPLERRQRYVKAGLLRLLKPSPQRQEPKCPIFASCGGCQLQHVTYAAQLQWKRERVRQVLTRLGGVKDPLVHPVLASAHPWDYRNKAQFPVAWQGGRAVLGFYAMGSHQLVPATECLVQHPLIRQAAATTAEHITKLGLTAYDEATGVGLLRHVLCRASFTYNEVLVTLVTTRAQFAGQEQLVAALRAELPALVGVTLNLNTKAGNRILGDVNRTLWGRPYLREVLQVGDLAVEFHVSAPSFFQVNPVQAQELFGVVLKYAQVTAESVVFDAYCGTGSIALLVARAGAKRVYGVEEVADAVADARDNARRNGITNATFWLGQAEKVGADLVEQEGAPDILIVDPPRAGLAPEFLVAATRFGARRWVYVSCNPATLARDVGMLQDNGYRLVEVQPVDMFPHTAHIECVALLVPA